MIKKLHVLIIIFVLMFNSSIQASAKPSMKLNISKLSLIDGEKFDLNIQDKSYGNTYKWTSSNTKIASVNYNGYVVAKKVGIATITCSIITKNNSKVTLKCNIDVKEKPIFFKFKLMAHAMGGYDGNIYNNTDEAFQVSYRNGFRFIETDLILTSDKEVVASHGWDANTYEKTGVAYNSKKPIMSYKEYMNTKIQGNFDTIDIDKVISYLKKYKDLYLELDIKADDKESAKIIATKIVELSDYDSSILDRVLIQFISEEAYTAINEVYNFKYYQYFAFRRDVRNIDDVIKFCKENGIVSVTINYVNLNDTVINKLKSNGLCILIHTIDDIELAKQFLDKGVDIICTNFLTPKDLK